MSTGGSTLAALESIRSSCEMLDGLRDVIARGRERIDGAQIGSRPSLRGPVGAFALTDDALERLEMEVSSAERDMQDRRSEMEARLARITADGADPREALVIDLYYLHGFPWRAVANAVGLSRSTCVRLRSRALERLGG